MKIYTKRYWSSIDAKMKIAVTSLITRKVAPFTDGGTEAFTYDLVERLVKKSYEVSLYSSSDSQTNAKLESVIDSKTACKEVLGEKLSFPYYLMLARKLVLNQGAYDLVHNNFFNTYLFSCFAPFIKKPVIHTIHNAYFNNQDWSNIIKKFGFFENEHLVFVSNNAKKIAGDIANSSVIYNGVDTNRYSLNLNPLDYFLWLGRMVPEKGAKEAIEVASVSSCRFIFNSVIKNNPQREYYEKYVKPFIGKNVVVCKNENFEEKVKVYQNAKGFLFPIQWEEPFGLVMIEAMSCGTPVVAFARGSVPEVVEDGETGFIINPSEDDIRGDWIIKKTGIEGLREAVEKIYSMPKEEYLKMRRACREHVEKNFTIERMVDSYEKIYLDILEKKKSTPRA